MHPNCRDSSRETSPICIIRQAVVAAYFYTFESYDDLSSAEIFRSLVSSKMSCALTLGNNRITWCNQNSLLLRSSFASRLTQMRCEWVKLRNQHVGETICKVTRTQSILKMSSSKDRDILQIPLRQFAREGLHYRVYISQMIRHSARNEKRKDIGLSQGSSPKVSGFIGRPKVRAKAVGSK